ncbi:MAG: FAD-binding oxidoreductase [Microlunatus sp.]|nr:FAD-binding oxidoreductase [Microlunatus sp.]MDN5805102.1 FAD-binding oxidoreductase [Microlunatus sp.]
MTRAVVVGAGIVGAACAYFLSKAGLDVVVVDRLQAGSGTTSRGEGNLLLSDKEPGPELRLAQLSRSLWLEVGDQLGRDALELEEKGGLVVASDPATLAELGTFAESQAAAGVEVRASEGEDLHRLEPQLSRRLAGGVAYPEDMQLQPVLATAELLHAARRSGAEIRIGPVATGRGTDTAGATTALRTDQGDIGADVIVNATGTWGGQLSRLLGAEIPVLPRRGFILVTEPLPKMIRHKVYSADYVANVASSHTGLETSCVIEGTRGGTVLIGASRERIGFDATLRPEVVRELARRAIELFPFLSEVRLLRVYHGFRPYCPDHRPVIGQDTRAPGVYHACGHEGAGIGLAAATGYLIAQQITGSPLAPELAHDLAAFSPARFHPGRLAEAGVTG